MNANVYQQCRGERRRGITGGLPTAVEFGVRKDNHTVESPDGLAWTARLPLSSATLNYLADLIRGHLKKTGSRWRRGAGKNRVTSRRRR